jgi:cytochrome b-561
MIVYRVFRNERKLLLKIAHSSLQALALIFSAIGLKAVFDSHNLATPPAQNLYTLHSWLGLTTIILFGLQV